MDDLRLFLMLYLIATSLGKSPFVFAYVFYLFYLSVHLFLFHVHLFFVLRL